MDDDPLSRTTDSDLVPRQRYEDAVEEVNHLRLQLKDAEKAQAKAEMDEALKKERAQAESVQRRRGLNKTPTPVGRGPAPPTRAAAKCDSCVWTDPSERTTRGCAR